MDTQALTGQHSRVSWAGIWAGLFVGLGIQIVLTALGLGIGLIASGSSATDYIAHLPKGVEVWSGLVWLLSAFLGGYVAAWMSGAYDSAAVCMVSLSFLGQSFGAMAAPNLIDITGGASPPQKYIVLPVPRGHLEAIQHSPFLEMAVKDPQGSKLGKLEKLIMDSSEGKIEYAVVAMNDGRLVALPWKSFTVSRNGKSVVLTAEQEQLTTALGETAKEIKNLMRPGMMSPTYTVRGELLGVEAADYVVNDAAGKKVRLHMENGTQMAGLPKVGDTIEAKVNEFHAAISVRTVAN